MLVNTHSEFSPNSHFLFHYTFTSPTQSLQNIGLAVVTTDVQSENPLGSLVTTLLDVLAAVQVNAPLGSLEHAWLSSFYSYFSLFF